jgi:hypothetical protein
MKFESEVNVRGRSYVLVKSDETINLGALHTLDGTRFLPLMNPETVGDNPKNFSPDRAFYNPIETDKEKSRKDQLINAAKG